MVSSRAWRAVRSHDEEPRASLARRTAPSAPGSKLIVGAAPTWSAGTFACFDPASLAQSTRGFVAPCRWSVRSRCWPVRPSPAPMWSMPRQSGGAAARGVGPEVPEDPLEGQGRTGRRTRRRRGHGGSPGRSERQRRRGRRRGHVRKLRICGGRSRCERRSGRDDPGRGRARGATPQAQGKGAARQEQGSAAAREARGGRERGGREPRRGPRLGLRQGRRRPPPFDVPLPSRARPGAAGVGAGCRARGSPP